MLRLLLLLLAITLTPFTSHCLSFETLQNKRILVVGGSGRVGGSVVTSLIQHGASVVVGGTSAERFESSRQRWRGLFPQYQEKLNEIQFVSVNREETESVQQVLTSKSLDLVVHTAGPFQGKVKAPNGILDACILADVPYIDVCDDYCTASAAKTKYAAKARVPCILSTGCWPGVSSLMAKQLVERTIRAYPNLQPSDLDVKFSFFTAG